MFLLLSYCVSDNSQEIAPVKQDDTSSLKAETAQNSLQLRNTQESTHEYPFKLRMRVHYRLCEDAIRWLLPVK